MPGFFLRIFILWGLCMAYAQAEELPLYELGAGVAGLSAPHYLGSDHQFEMLAPVPYVVYRGEHLQADRSGVRAILFGNDQLDLSLSFNGGLPVDSEDNDDRAGMPDLDWLLEAGPVLRYTAWASESGAKLRLDLPLRAAFTVDDFSLGHQGWTSSPSVVYIDHYLGWRSTLSAAALWGDRRYQGYFYDVEPQYATSWRQPYKADSGFMGTQLTFSLTRRVGNWFVGGFTRYYNLSGAANRESPLLETGHNLAAGFIVIWVFSQSGKTVSTPEP